MEFVSYTEKDDEMVLALMWLVIHGDRDEASAWKRFDWDTLDCLREVGLIILERHGATCHAAFGRTWTPVTPIILTSRSQETETVAPFLTADTFDRATPDLLTISFRVRPDFPIALTANLDNSALYFIRIFRSAIAASFSSSA